MPALSRATAVAAVALVAVVGAGGLIYLNSRTPDDAGGATTSPAVAPTTTTTGAPPSASTPQPSFVAPGITGWKTYTSPVYGYTISYPEDWSVANQATEKWQPGAAEDDPAWRDIFFNNLGDIAGVDNSMVFETAQSPAPARADLASWNGLVAALTEMCAKPAKFLPDTCADEAVLGRLCMGSPGCLPVAFVDPKVDLPRAYFGDPETGIVTYVRIGRVDGFPAGDRYGGTVKLLKLILGQLGVREPQPGETPD
jgi:hypothetical protein